jgi:vancomycin resistance protein YoaR
MTRNGHSPAEEALQSASAGNAERTVSADRADGPAAHARPQPSPRPAPQPTPRPAPLPAPRPTPAPAPRDKEGGDGGDNTESPTVRTAVDRPASEAPIVRDAAPGVQAEPRPGPDATTVVVRAQAGGGDASWAGSGDEVTQELPRVPGRPPADHEPPTERIPIPPPPQPRARADPSGPDHLDGGDRGAGGRNGGRGRRTLLVITAIIGALGLLYGADLVLGSGSVPRGVTVAGIPVGGMALGEAEQVLRSEIGSRTAGPIAVTVGDASGEVDPATAGLSVDWASTLELVGHQPLNPITRIISFFAEREIGVVSTADPTALNQALEQLGPVVDRAPIEGSVRFEGTQPQPVDPQPGQQLDVAGSAAVLQRDWANGGAVALPMIELPPTTTAEDVAAAIQAVARPAVAAPVTVVGENEVRGTVTPEVIAATLSFRAENGDLVPELNQQAVQDALAPQMAESERPGRDATFDFSGGRPVVVPSQDGRGVDYEATLAALVDVLGDPAPREVTAIYGDQPADVTTEELQALGNPEIIGEFTTGGFAADSGLNIRRAAELVNGTVVQPGETFSLDAATGPRTAANGYVEAGVIDNGRASRGIAGGASQVSTTLYNAAYFAGMTLVEHQAHSYYISRYPAGREATIATGAIDNKFRNDNPTPVLIRTQWTPTSLTVQIYGQRQFEVTGEFGPRTKPTQPNEVTISDEECHPSNGLPGFTITDTRTLRNVSTGEVRRETITTRYNPAPRVVCED